MGSDGGAAHATARWARKDGGQFRTGIRARMEDWAIVGRIESSHGEEGEETSLAPQQFQEFGHREVSLREDGA
jgi:hypothetical protein